jgi:virulence-associated protein VapD
MYAIAFDMDIESLRTNYGDPYNNAYMEIKRVLGYHFFLQMQVYQIPASTQIIHARRRRIYSTCPCQCRRKGDGRRQRLAR